MTPADWYTRKRAEYRAATGRDWTWRDDQGDCLSDAKKSEVRETAMRAAVECRALKANGWDEIMLVANAVLIREYLNTHKV